MRWADPYRSLVSDGMWSSPGTQFDEMTATKRPVDPKVPTAALEQADRKTLSRLPAHSRPTARDSV